MTPIAPGTISAPRHGVVRLLCILCVCALPCAAAAQPWADAYRARDYATAANLLQPVVVEQALQLTNADPAPARHLAVLYAQGRGVALDTVAACALAQASEMATQFAPLRYASAAGYDAALKKSERFRREHCDGLADADRTAATLAIGCFAFGMPEDVFPLGDQTVQVGRGGIRLTGALEQPGDTLMGCPQLVARVRPLTVVPPPDAPPGVTPRHFVELLGWQVGRAPQEAETRSTLFWLLYELRGDTLEFAAFDSLYAIHDWPRPALPPDFDARFTLEMIRSGHVRWRLDGAPPKRGWIMLPEEKTIGRPMPGIGRPVPGEDR